MRLLISSHITQNEYQSQLSHKILHSKSEKELFDVLSNVKKDNWKQNAIREWNPVFTFCETLISQYISQNAVYKIAKLPQKSDKDSAEKKKQSEKNTPSFSIKQEESLLQILEFISFLLGDSAVSWRSLHTLSEKMIDLLVARNPVVVLAALKVLTSHPGIAFGINSFATKPATYHRLLTLAFGYGENSLIPTVEENLSQSIIDRANDINIKIYNDTYRKQRKQKSGSDGGTLPETHIFNIQNIVPSTKSALELYKSVTQGKNLHKSDQFDVWTMIRLSKDLNSHDSRMLWNCVRMKAVESLCKANAQAHYIAGFLHFQPAFIKELKELISNEKMDEKLRAHGVSALKCICSTPDYKDSIVSTLIPVGSDACHGFLSTLLREIYEQLSSGNPIQQPRYVKALFSLVSLLARIAEKSFLESDMLSQILSLANEAHEKKEWFIFHKSLRCLVTLTSGRSSSTIMPQLMQGDTVEKFIEMIHKNVSSAWDEYGSSQATEDGTAPSTEASASSDKTTTTTTTTSSHTSSASKIKTLQSQMLESRYNSLFALFDLMRAVSKTPDVSVRSILESTFPKDIKLILQNQFFFGRSLVSVAVRPLNHLMNAEPILIPLVKNVGILDDLITAFQKEQESVEVVNSSSLLMTFALNKSCLEEIINSDVLEALIERVISSSLHTRLAETVGSSLGTFARHHPEIQERIAESIVKSIGTISDKCSPEKVDDVAQIVKNRESAPGSEISSVMSAESRKLIQNVQSLGTMILSFLNRQSVARAFVQEGGAAKLSELALKCGVHKRILRMILRILEILGRRSTTVDVLKSHAHFIVENFSDVKFDPETYFDSPQQRAVAHSFLFACSVLLSRRNAQMTITVTGSERIDAYTVLKQSFPVIMDVFPKLHQLNAHLRLVVKKQKEQEKEAAAKKTDKDKSEKKITPQQVIFSALNNDLGNIVRLFDALQRFVFHSVVDESRSRVADASEAYSLCDTVAEATEKMFTKQYEIAVAAKQQGESLEVRSDAGAGIMDYMFSLVFSSIHHNLNAALLLSLRNKGALKAFAKYFDALSTEILDDYKPKKKKNEKKSEDSFIVSACFFMQKILNVEWLLHNPLTGVMTTKKDFDPHKFVESLACTFAPTIAKLMHHPNVAKTDAIVTEMIINVVARMEKSTVPEETADALTESMSNSTKIVSELALEQLLSMGFPRARCESALLRFHNDVQMATEFLLSNPVEEEEEEEEKQPEQKEEEKKPDTTQPEATKEEQEDLKKIRSEASDWCLNLAQNSTEDISYACSDLWEVAGAKKTRGSVAEKLISVLKKPTTKSEDIQQSMQSVLNIIAPPISKGKLTKENLAHDGESAVQLLLDMLKKEIEKNSLSDSAFSILRVIHTLTERREIANSWISSPFSEPTKREKSPVLLSTDESVQLISTVIDSLKKHTTSEKKVERRVELLLNILDHVTADFDVSKQAMQLGLPDILASLSFDLPSHHFVITIDSILRHMVEEPKSVRQALEYRVREYFKSTRTSGLGNASSTHVYVDRLLQDFSDELSNHPDVFMDVVKSECKLNPDRRLTLKDSEKTVEVPPPNNALKTVLETLVKVLVSYSTRSEKDKLSLREADLYFILARFVRFQLCAPTLLNDFNSLTKEPLVKYVAHHSLSHFVLPPSSVSHVSPDQRTRHHTARMATYFLNTLLSVEPAAVFTHLNQILNDSKSHLRVIYGVVGLLRTIMEFPKVRVSLLQHKMVEGMMTALNNIDLDHPDASDVVAQITVCIDRIAHGTKGFISKSKLENTIKSLPLVFSTFERNFSRDRDSRFHQFAGDYDDEEEDFPSEEDEEEDDEDEESPEDEDEEDDDEDEDDEQIISEEEVWDEIAAAEDEEFIMEDEDDMIGDDTDDLVQRIQSRLYGSDDLFGNPFGANLLRSRSRPEPQYERVAASQRDRPGANRFRGDALDPFINEILGSSRNSTHSTRQNVAYYSRILMGEMRDDNNSGAEGPASNTSSSSRTLYNMLTRRRGRNSGLADMDEDFGDSDPLMPPDSLMRDDTSEGSEDLSHTGMHGPLDLMNLLASRNTDAEDRSDTDGGNTAGDDTTAENQTSQENNDQSESNQEQTEEAPTTTTTTESTSEQNSSSAATSGTEQPQQTTDQDNSASEAEQEEFSIDPTFLAALPNELRAEILSQHIASLVNPNAETSENESTISQAFLNALPDDDIRGEVLRQEREYLAQQRQRREAQQSSISESSAGDNSSGQQPTTTEGQSATTTTTTTTTNASAAAAQNENSADNETSNENNNSSGTDVNETVAFITSLPPNLREEVLITSDPSVIAQLPPDLAAEARMLRSRYAMSAPLRESTRAPTQERQQSDSIRHARHHIHTFIQNQDKQKKHEKEQKSTLSERIPIFTDAHIASLFKLLYLSRNKCRKELLSIFVHLCRRTHYSPIIIQCIVDILRGQSSTNSHSSLFHNRLFGEPPIVMFALCRKENTCPPISVVQRVMDLLHTLLNEEPAVNKFANKEVDTGSDSKKVALLYLLELLADDRVKQNGNVLLQLVHILHDSVEYFVRIHNSFKEANTALGKDLEKLEKKEKKSDSEEKDIKKLNLKLSSYEKHEAKLQTVITSFITNDSVQYVGDILTSRKCPAKAAKRAVLLINNMCLLNPDCRQEILQKLADLARNEGKVIAKSLRSLSSANESIQQQRDNIQRETRFCRLITTYTAILKSAESELQQAMKVLESSNLDTSDLQTQQEAMHVLSDYQFDYIWEALQLYMRNTEIKPSSPHFSRLIPLVEAFFSFQSIFIREEHEDEDLLVQRMDLQTPTTGTPVGRIESFLEDNRDVLNEVVRSNPHLLDESLSLFIAKYPKFVDFDNKRTWFKKALAKDREKSGAHRGILRMNVRREYIFVDAFFNVRQRSPEELKQRLNVRFQGEEGADAGGLTRDFFLVLSKEMFNPNYALFTRSADRLFQPNPYSYVNSEHLDYFQFVARVIGMAIYNNQLLDCFFTRSFYKHILGKKITYHDIESVDPDLYKNLKWMLENDITDIIDSNFTARVDEFGKHKVIELKENGENIPVTNENKHEYVKLRTELSMTTQIKKQLEAFLSAFYEIIPRRLISIFNSEELELLISGLPEFDVEDLKRNTEYHGYSPDDEVIEWFWKWVEDLNQNDRALFLQFVTGTSKVPLDGFEGLVGMHGIQKFNIHRVNDPNLLPTAHTCFNQLDLSNFETEEQLRKSMYIAIREGSSGFYVI